MPATEKTWRDQARMHIIFGVSALVMLIGTIWMLAKDHNREWRRWQLDDRQRNRWTTEAQLAQTEAETRAKRDDLRRQLAAARRTKVDAALVQRFKELVAAEDKRLQDQGVAETPADFTQLDAALTELENTEGGSEAAEEARADLLTAMDRFVTEARRRENSLLTEKKFLAAEQTAAVSARGLAVGEGRPTGQIETQIQELTARILEKDAALAEAKDYRLALEAVVGEIRGTEVELDKQLAGIEADLTRMHENLPGPVKTVGEWVNRMPVLDALYTGDIKLDQIWLPDMKINYNFSYVARYDRCIVCHRAIDKTAPGSATEPAYPAIPRGERDRSLVLPTPAEQTVEAWYGITLAPPDMAVAGGAIAAEVAAGSRVALAGLQRGDVILEINGAAVNSVEEIERHLLQLPSNARNVPLAIKVRRADGDEELIEPGTPVEAVYGLRFAASGQVNAESVTIQVIYPNSRAALAGLQMGDVLLEVNEGPVKNLDHAEHYLLQQVEWGQPLSLLIRRGLNQPFTSHPRLDLFVGPTSPHKKGEMGCSICHDGQGSATDFKWASHTPNDPQQAVDWARQHGWFDNHHWIFPMTPERFLESNCLKCHHEVVELEPSERFPEPPAPKLVQGYHLVREFGCYGCHEITGFDGPNKRIGPDMRLEPNYYEVASQILADPAFEKESPELQPIQELARTLAEQPDDASARGELREAIRADAALTAPADGGNGAAASETASATEGQQQPRLSAATHALASALEDVDVPGRFRKVGPSLRHLDAKVDYSWLYSWIRRPTDFRPSTRMPQFFLHYEHLNGQRKDFPTHDAEGNVVNVTDREYTARFENIEIRALAEYLLATSQPYEYIDPPQGVTEQTSAERGKWLFESRGCLACHSHSEFPGIASNQGPDLSRIAAKFNTEKGRRWLYSWLRDPKSYHTRTVMPNVFLDPIEEVDATGNPTGRVTDPAADVAAFLLGVPADWQPEVEVPAGELSPDERAALNDLTTVWLSASFPRRRAERFAKDGIDERLAATVKVDEQILIGKYANEDDRTRRQLEYIARRSLSRYGCFGCHDIPGYETAKPIGTPLANWGRKDPAQLAFENIGAFLASHGVDAANLTNGESAGHGQVHPEETIGVGHTSETTVEAIEEDHGESHGHIDPLDDQYDRDTAYFLQSLLSHQRNGFLWQKLRMPRSYDYEATRNKRYDERLRMPKFNFTAAEREAVMTFILGLTSEAPAERYIYKPGPREQAIVQGRHMLDKFNCAGCHILDMDRWEIAFEPDWFEEPPTTTDYPFMIPRVTPEQIQASLEPDRRGLLHAELHGMPTRDEATGAPRVVDQDGVPIEPDDTESEPFYEFQLYKHAVVAGATRMVGVQNLMIPAKRDGTGPARGTAYPGKGGDLAKYLYPRVIAEEKKTNPAAVASEAWGWLPPPLHHEGEKVQTDWLHDFLMDPTAIRPAVVMRMPNFHMSSDEAAKLVNYFAAASNAEFPYEYNARRRGGYLAQLEQSHPELLDDAMKVITDGNYCVKCHSIGDYQVRGAVKTLGPNLDEVYRRLRPDYMHHWIANPQRILPYTGMPVNIPYDPNSQTLGGVAQALFPGTSLMQLDGVVNLLMNFDEYTRRQTSVKGLVREPTAPAAGTPPAASDQPPNDRSASR
jgi:cytochrome c551/c552